MRKLALLTGALLTSIVLLSGCSPASGPNPFNPLSQQGAPPPVNQESTAPEPVVPQPPSVIQEESCDWPTGRLPSGSPAVPTAQDGALAQVLIGSWQHTHIDEGAGFEELSATTDIRYVFPSTSRILYCQDVAGATSQAQNAADIQLSGTELVLPSPATGYTITAWDADTMVWENHRDGSLYLLQRR